MGLSSYPHIPVPTVMISVKKIHLMMSPFFVLCGLVSTVLAAHDSFTLYAYGTNISGLQLFYSQGPPYLHSLQNIKFIDILLGIAQIGDVRHANSSNVSNVYCKLQYKLSARAHFTIS